LKEVENKVVQNFRKELKLKQIDLSLLKEDLLKRILGKIGLLHQYKRRQDLDFKIRNH
jgi:hypothetical protein